MYDLECKFYYYHLFIKVKVGVILLDWVLWRFISGTFYQTQLRGSFPPLSQFGTAGLNVCHSKADRLGMSSLSCTLLSIFSSFTSPCPEASFRFSPPPCGCRSLFGPAITRLTARLCGSLETTPIRLTGPVAVPCRPSSDPPPSVHAAGRPGLNYSWRSYAGAFVQF